MDRVGTALVLTSAVGFGTLGIFGELAAAAGLSIPTVLAYRFVLATLFVWVVLGVRGDLRVDLSRCVRFTIAWSSAPVMRC